MTPEALMLLKVAMEAFSVCLANGISRENLVDGIDKVVAEQEARKDALMRILSESE